MLFERRGQNLWVPRSQSLRRLIDLQYRSILESLTREVSAWPKGGLALDFGAGRKPYTQLWPRGWSVTSVDLDREHADFENLEDVPEALRFDRILALEVFEHLERPEQVLRQLKARLTPGGQILISVPFSARIHPAPSDYQRWTPQGLERLAADAGLRIRKLEYRGGELASIVQKLNYYFFRRLKNPGIWMLGLLALPLMLIAQGLLLISGGLSRETPNEDPLGFFLILE